MSLPITNQPHNTQELDEILGKLHNSVVDFAETGAGNPFEGAEFAKDEILAWHNKQVEAKLAHISEYAENVISIDESGEFSMKAIPLSLVAAERNKLKEEV